jgi:hypothetical protein
MLTGYSQADIASMAAHRLLSNATEINVVAGAHLAGLYNLSACSSQSTRLPVSVLCALPDRLAKLSTALIPHQRCGLLPAYATGRLKPCCPAPR